MFKRVRPCMSLLCLAVLGAAFSLAQAPVGSLDGSVHDPSGAVMPGVEVTVTNKDNGAERKVTTGNAGVFSVSPLTPGNYSIKADAAGFRAVEVTALVQVGQVTSVDLVMQVGAANETVSVEGEATAITYDSHEISGVINRNAIQNLPLNGRDFLQLAMLEPGVSVSAGNNGQYNQNFNVNILGASSTNNSVRITVDGATVQDAVTGGTQQNFSQDVVQEFQLSSTNMDLSTGIGAGGAINIVTRSGGNDFHGSGYFFYRDHNLSAFPSLGHDPGEPSSPYFARKQEGFVISGPIIKNKLFFFSSLEHTDQTSLFSAYSPALPQFSANTDGALHSNTITEKFNWNINAKNTASLRYSHDGNNSFAPPTTGVLPSDWNYNKNWADSGVFSLITVVTPATANEFRFSMTFWSNNLEAPTAADCPAPCLGLGGPSLTILGTGLTMGQATNVPQSRILRRFVWADNVSTQKGNHSIKYGGYLEHQIGYGTYAYASGGSDLVPNNSVNLLGAAAVLWSPAQIENFNQHGNCTGPATNPVCGPEPIANQIAVPNLSTGTYADLLKLPVYGFDLGYGQDAQPPLWMASGANHDNLMHIYAEDSWKIRPKFTLNYGLAWSYETNALNHDISKPAYLEPIFGANGLGPEQHSPHNFSPMLGFAWALGKDNKTVIRGGAAIYYDTWNISNRLIERALMGPVGTGRVLLSDSTLFSYISGIAGIACPPVCSLSQQPTNATGDLLVNLLPLAGNLITGLLKEANPAATNIQLFKTAPESSLIPENFRLPYSEHVSVGVQHELRNDLLFSADFVFRQYMHELITGADLNHFYSINGPVIPQCGPTVAITNTSTECSTGVIEANVSGARGHYTGLLMKLDKRFSHRTVGTLSYAYADQVGYNGMVDQTNYFASWGPQAGHQTLTGSIAVDLPWGMSVSGITSFQSAPPFEPYIAGIDLNGNGALRGGENYLGGQPLPGASFNSFNVSTGPGELIKLINQFNATYGGKTDAYGTPIPYLPMPASNFGFQRSFNSQDIRITKTIKLHGERAKLAIFGECFNVFNIANLTGYNSNLAPQQEYTAAGLPVYTAAGAPVLISTFGQPTQRASNTFGSGGPRAFQFAARLSF